MEDSFSKLDDVALEELLVFYKGSDLCYASGRWLELQMEREKQTSR